MKHRTQRPAFRRGSLFVALGLCLANTAIAQEQEKKDATTLDRIEITGSRIKRADVEGALPVTVIGRQDIETSGRTTVADLLQSSSFNSFGSFTPTSGSSAQSFAGLSLRGLGAERTLILIDGRRAAVSPLSGEGQDLSSIPSAAVERIEILTDGASAIYGADAIGGVVNIITRKDFEGFQISTGLTDNHYGGDGSEGSILFGTVGERGRIMGGISYTDQKISYVRDYPWSSAVAGSSYSNNYLKVLTAADGSTVPGSNLYTNGSSSVPGGCDGTNFYESTSSSGNTSCLYNFVGDMADTASIKNKNLFLRSEYTLTDNWTLNADIYVNKKRSMSVYAPVPESIYVSADSPNNTTGQAVYIKHRFAALGNRYTYTDENAYDVNLSLHGQLTDSTSVEFGVRSNESRATVLGYNYVNIPVAEQYFESGAYNVFDPYSNSEEVLDAIRTTISRDTFYKQKEVSALLSTDLFALPGGVSALAVGAEYSKHDYQDLYDAQSEAGNVGGSAGNSAWGNRNLASAYAEWSLPFLSSLSADLALRHDRYSDFGNATSPKLSLRYQPLDTLTLRASYGEGFRAPTLQALNQQTAFSAYSVTDAATALAYGLNASSSVQINGYSVANPDLKAEQSKQFSVGLAWDPTSWANLTLDYWKTRIDNQIKWYSAQTVINRTALGQYLPDNLYVTRNEDGSILAVYAGYGNEGRVETDGIDLNLRTRFDLGEWGRLSSTLQGTWTHSYTIAGLTGEDEYIGTSGYPEWRANLNTRWELGDWSFSWTINAIGYNPGYYVTYYEGTYSCSQLKEWGYTKDCGGAYITHDVQVSYNAPWNATISLGARNLTDKAPVYDAYYSPTNFDSDLYNGYGRQLYIRYTQNF
ncbi:MAG: TonB-dependent receptor [Pseudomonas sp.]